MPIIEDENGREIIVPTDDGKFWDDERNFSVEDFMPCLTVEGKIVFMSVWEGLAD